MRTIIITFVLTCLVGCYGVTPENTGLEGKPLPPISLLLIDSSTWLSTSNISKEQPFAIFLFSPHCLYCRAQTKEIIENIQELKSIRFYFVSNSPMPLLQNYYKEYHLSQYTNIVLGRDTANAIARYFEAPGIPYMAIYGKNHILNHSYMGKIASEQIQEVAKE